MGGPSSNRAIFHKKSRLGLLHNDQKMTLWGHSKQVAIRKPGRAASEETKSAKTLICNFQPPGSREINFLLGHWVCSILLWQS